MKPISGSTSLTGLIGNPVSHSLSPIIHNAAFAEMDLDWCYLAIPCEEKNLKNITNALINMNCKGLNITIPYKTNFIDICKNISPLANQIGAINTLIKNNTGEWNGDNTDVEGFIEPLKFNNWNSKNAIILGYGGSARAVAAGLKILDFKNIIIIGRNQMKLDDFMNQIKLNIFSEGDSIPNIEGIIENNTELIEYIKKADLVVNTTPVGMATVNKMNNYEIDMPLNAKIWDHLKKSATIYDLIYTPRPTKWLQNCKKITSNQIDGLEMLIHQGAASLRLWSGFTEIPIKIMREAALRHLNH